MSHCYRGMINLPVFNGQGGTAQGVLSTLDQGRQPITQGIKGHLRTLPLSAFSCEKGKHLSYIYTSVNQNAGKAIKYITMQAGDIHESYTLKIKDVLITKLIHVLQNRIKNRKTKETI